MARNDRFAFSGTQGDTDVLSTLQPRSDDVSAAWRSHIPPRDRGTWTPPRNADEWLAAGQISGGVIEPVAVIGVIRQRGSRNMMCAPKPV